MGTEKPCRGPSSTRAGSLRSLDAIRVFEAVARTGAKGAYSRISALAASARSAAAIPKRFIR
jgi:hypothetical protein